MNVSNLGQKNFLDNINLLLIWLLPIGIVIGSLIINLLILIIIAVFFLNIFLKKETYILKNKFLYFLYFITFYLIFSALINFEDFGKLDIDSFIRSSGFIRYFLLSFALGYYIKKFGNEKILPIWALFFLIVTVDLIFEFYNGSNLLGFTSDYQGRLAGFTGDELKIGGFYFGFVLLILSFIYKKKSNFFFPFAILFLFVGLMIGERANFIKIFILLFFSIFIIDNNNILKKIYIFLISLGIGIFIFLLFFNLEQKNKIEGRFYSQIFKNRPDLNLFENIKRSSRHYSHHVTSIKIFQDNPLFGVGLKKFRKMSHEEKYNKMEYGFFGGSTHPHQVHMELLTETGLIGYILFISFFIYFIFIGIKEYFIEKNIFLLSSVMFILVSILPIIPSGSFFTTYTATIFWINFSFLIGNSRIINFR